MTKTIYNGFIPVQTYNWLNRRSHWAKRAKEQKAVKEANRMGKKVWVDALGYNSYGGFGA